MKTLYTAHATATGGRNGHTATDNGTVSVDLSIPKEMGGPGKAGAANPEQLFAAGYAACFGSAVEFVARQQKKPVKEVTVKADVSIGTPASGQGFELAVALTVSIPGLPQDEARALAEAAHQVCPYSNATRGNIEVTLAVE